MTSRRNLWKRWLLPKVKKTARYYCPRLEALEDRAIPALAGSLDSLLGVGGAAYAQFGAGAAQSYGIYRDDLTGHIYAVGFANNGASGDDIAIVRFNADGSRDFNFGNQGQVLTTIAPANGGDYAEDVTGGLIGGEFKLIVVGESWNGTNYDISVVRYNADGSLDTSFGGDGTVTAGFPANQDDKAYRVVFDNSTGQTLVAGSTYNGVSDEFALVRFNQDGSLDSTFGNLGMVNAQFGTNDVATGLAIDAGRNIVVGGSSQSAATGFDFVAARFRETGVLDPSFNASAGFIRVNVSSGPGDDFASSLRIDGAGQIVIGGTVTNGSTTDFGLIRLQPSGTLDDTFAGTGKAVVPIAANQDDALNDIAIDSQGRIIAVGTTHVGTFPNSRFNTVVVRFDPAGGLDSAFGTGGITVTQLSNKINDAADDARAVTVDDADNVLVAGHSPLHDGNDVFDVLRYVATAGAPGTTLVANPDFYTILENQTLDLSSSGFLGLIANDTIVNNSPVAAVLAATVSVGSLTSFTAGGSFIYTPPPGFSGTATLTYSLSDGVNTSAPASVTIDVLGVNSAPIIVAGASTIGSIPEDVLATANTGTLVSDILAGAGYADADTTDAQGIAVTLAGALGGVWQFSIDGGSIWSDFPFFEPSQGLHLFDTALVRFLPGADFNGTVSFDYIGWDRTNVSAAVNDGVVAFIETTGGNTPYSAASRTANLVITPVNDPPVAAQDDSLPLITEDAGPTPISFATLLANDSAGPGDESGQTLTITGVSNVVGGTANIVGTDVIFTPNPDFYGPASFDYTVIDDGTTNGAPDPLTATGSVFLAISEVNDDPTANPNVLPDILVGGGQSVGVSALLSNDSAGPGDEAIDQILTFVDVANPLGGSVFNAEGTIIFSATPGYTGPAGFTYTITDNGTTADISDFRTAVGTVSFNILSPGGDLSVNVTEQSGPTAVVGVDASFAINVVNNGPVASSSVRVSGGLPGNAAFVSATGTFSFSPKDITWSVGPLNPGESVLLTLTLKPTVASTLAFSATVSAAEVDPNPENNSGSAAVSVATITAGPLKVFENKPNSSAGSLQGFDDQSTPLTLSVAPVDAGDFAVDNKDPANPVLVALSPFNFETTPTRDVLIQGISKAGDVYFRSFTVAIVDANDPPVADGFELRIAEDQTLTLPVVAASFDEDSDPLTIVAVGPAANGVASIVGGDIVYQPNLDYVGPDEFTYTIGDGRGGFSTATVFLFVFPVNDPPRSGPDLLADIAEDSGPFTVNPADLMVNDTPGPANEFGSLSFVGVFGAVGGTVFFDGSTITFLPFADFNGPAGFSYTVQEIGGSGEGEYFSETQRITGFSEESPGLPTSSFFVRFNVTPVNDVPTVQDQFLPAFNADFGPIFIPWSVLLQNSSPGPANEVTQRLAGAAVFSAVGGTVTAGVNGVVFNPTSGFAGRVSFVYLASDNGTTNGQPDPKSAAGTVNFTAIRTTTPPAAISPGAGNSTTSTSSNILLRRADGTAGGDGASLSNAVVVGDSEFSESVRLLFGGPPQQATLPVQAWGTLDARLAVVSQIIQMVPEFRPAGQTLGFQDAIPPGIEAPRRGRLLQIVTSQFDGEDNVWIIEGLLRELRSAPQPPANRPSNAPPPGSPNPAPPAPEQTSWLKSLEKTSIGLVLFMGLAANLAFGPILDKDVFHVPPRKRRRAK
jgi:uncharacterized delta-60 repeat protein